MFVWTIFIVVTNRWTLFILFAFTNIIFTLKIFWAIYIWSTRYFTLRGLCILNFTDTFITFTLLCRCAFFITFLWTNFTLLTLAQTIYAFLFIWTVFVFVTNSWTLFILFAFTFIIFTLIIFGAICISFTNYFTIRELCSLNFTDTFIAYTLLCWCTFFITFFSVAYFVNALLIWRTFFIGFTWGFAFR